MNNIEYQIQVSLKSVWKEPIFCSGISQLAYQSVKNVSHYNIKTKLKQSL